MHYLSRVDDGKSQVVIVGSFAKREGEHELLAVFKHLYLPFAAPFLEFVFTYYGFTVIYTHGELVAAVVCHRPHRNNTDAYGY